MRTIYRDNYTPKVGDYHNVVVFDNALGNIWLFDCDGIYLDLSKTDVRVVNEAGQSTEYAISQKFVTDNLKSANDKIGEVDQESQRRDQEIKESLTQAEEELQSNLDRVENESKSRDSALQTQFSDGYKEFRDNIGLLNDATQVLSEEVEKYATDGIFGIEFGEGTALSLDYVKGTQKNSLPIREATEAENGLMSVAAYNQLKQNTDDISRLQSGGIYRGSFATLAAAPTTTPNEAFIGGEINTDDIITIQEAEHEGKTGIARYRAQVSDWDVSYTFDAFTDEDIKNFAQGQAGLIVGGTADGTVAAKVDGTGAVNGWDALKADLSSAEENIATNASAIQATNSNLTSTNQSVAALSTQLSTLSQTVAEQGEEVSAVQNGLNTTNSSLTALGNKSVDGGTTLSTNTSPLVTVPSMMARWVDITDTGLPASPDINTFYYTVEE